MLVYGDSVTHGNTVRHSCNHYIPRLAQAMNVQVRNKDIAGTTTFPEMAQLESPYDPDYVLVAYGSNDWDRYEEAFFAENYRLMMQLIAEKYPRQCEAIRSCIHRLNRLEKEGCPNPDEPAACFGMLMAELLSLTILKNVHDNPSLNLLLETIISTIIIIFTGEFIPKALFRINPNSTMKRFALPTFLLYILLYPFLKSKSIEF